MKIFNYINILGTLGATALLAACSSKDDYTPGPEVQGGCQQVHFLDTNNPVSVLDATDTNDRTATLTLKRNNTGAALTVPVTVVSKAEGLEIPTEVTFATGESVAQLAIKAPQSADTTMVFNYEIRLEGNDVDPYARLDGGCAFSGQLNFPKVKPATFWFTKNSKGATIFGRWTEAVMYLGEKNFFIKNFMNSGENLWLSAGSDGSLTMKSDGWTKDCIVPDTQYPGCTYYDFKKLINQQLQPYPLYPLGNAEGKPWITALGFYGDSQQSFYDTNGKWGQIYVSSAKYSNGLEDTWVLLAFAFD